MKRDIATLVMCDITRLLGSAEQIRRIFFLSSESFSVFYSPFKTEISLLRTMGPLTMEERLAQNIARLQNLPSISLPTDYPRPVGGNKLVEALTWQSFPTMPPFPS